MEVRGRWSRSQNASSFSRQRSLLVSRCPARRPRRRRTTTSRRGRRTRVHASTRGGSKSTTETTGTGRRPVRTTASRATNTLWFRFRGTGGPVYRHVGLELRLRHRAHRLRRPANGDRRCCATATTTPGPTALAPDALLHPRGGLPRAGGRLLSSVTAARVAFDPIAPATPRARRCWPTTLARTPSHCRPAPRSRARTPRATTSPASRAAHVPRAAYDKTVWFAITLTRPGGPRSSRRPGSTGSSPCSAPICGARSTATQAASSERWARD